MRFRGVDEVEATVRRGSASSEALGPLFEDRVIHSGKDTSRAAGVAARGKAERDRARIVQALRDHRALTRDELEEVTGISGNAVRPRCVELIEAKVVVELELKAPTRSGRLAHLLTLADMPGVPRAA